LEHRDFKEEWKHRKSCGFEDYPDEEDIQWMEKELLPALDEKDEVIILMTNLVDAVDALIRDVDTLIGDE